MSVMSFQFSLLMALPAVLGGIGTLWGPAVGAAILIPLTERHLKITVEEWRRHYNRGRPHSSLGPGVPESNRDPIPASGHRHRLLAGYGIAKTAVLGGLHHEYRLVKEAA